MGLYYQTGTNYHALSINQYRAIQTGTG